MRVVFIDSSRAPNKSLPWREDGLLKKEKETADKVMVDWWKTDPIDQKVANSVLFGDLLHDSRKQKFEKNLIQVLIKYVSSKSWPFPLDMW